MQFFQIGKRNLKYIFLVFSREKKVPREQSTPSGDKSHGQNFEQIIAPRFTFSSRLHASFKLSCQHTCREYKSKRKWRVILHLVATLLALFYSNFMRITSEGRLLRADARNTPLFKIGYPA